MAQQIIITLKDDGRLDVTSPTNKIISLGMIELAKKAILDPSVNQIIVPARETD